jgi:hypothetical protein
LHHVERIGAEIRDHDLGNETRLPLVLPGRFRPGAEHGHNWRHGAFGRRPQQSPDDGQIALSVAPGHSWAHPEVRQPHALELAVSADDRRRRAREMR